MALRDQRHRARRRGVEDGITADSRRCRRACACCAYGLWRVRRRDRHKEGTAARELRVDTGWSQGAASSDASSDRRRRRANARVNTRRRARPTRRRHGCCETPSARTAHRWAVCSTAFTLEQRGSNESKGLDNDPQHRRPQRRTDGVRPPRFARLRSRGVRIQVRRDSVSHLDSYPT